jgi:hypothetical protein
MTDLISIFCEIDDFCKDFLKQVKIGEKKRVRKMNLGMSEVMTLSIWYHYSGYATFKDYYTKHVQEYLKRDFPGLVSYNRFIELRKTIVMPMLIFLCTRKLGFCSGISFIDSFKLEACHVKRSSSHKTLQSIAKKGKTSMGWFYGMKVHVIINHRGEIITFYISSGNVADNNELVLFKMTKNIMGKLFGDKGYIVNPKRFQNFYEKGIQLITKIRENMQNKLMDLTDKLLLRKRGIIESVGDILKEHLHMEHTRHRSAWAFFLHIFTSLTAYQLREKKPTLSAESLLKLLNA